MLHLISKFFNSNRSLNPINTQRIFIFMHRNGMKHKIKHKTAFYRP